MKPRTAVLTLALCLVAAGLCAAADNPNSGTWKLNEAKSKIPSGFPKNTTVVYEMAGDNIKVTTDGVDGSGNPAHSEWTGKFDGKDYPVTGDPSVDTRAVKGSDNDHHLALTNKKGDKVVSSGTVHVAKDGKTRVLEVTRTDSKGQKQTGKYFYDKQ